MSPRPKNIWYVLQGKIKTASSQVLYIDRVLSGSYRSSEKRDRLSTNCACLVLTEKAVLIFNVPSRVEH
jgi:hypothetical protein